MDDSLSKCYRLSTPVDIRTAVEQTGSDHLVVNDERLLAIFNSAVLDVVITKGDLKTAGVVEIEQLESPIQSQDTAPLTKAFSDQLQATTESEWTEFTAPP